MKVDKDYVRKHLKELGYDQVPDDLLVEFMADLQSKLGSYPSEDHHPDPSEPVSKLEWEVGQSSALLPEDDSASQREYSQVGMTTLAETVTDSELDDDFHDTISPEHQREHLPLPHFADDLEPSLTSAQEQHQIPTNTTLETEVPGLEMGRDNIITAAQVRHHLKSLGYNIDQLPEDFILDLANDLNAERSMLFPEPEPPTPEPVEPEEPEPGFDAGEFLDRLARLDLSGIHQTLQRQRQELRNRPSVFYTTQQPLSRPSTSQPNSLSVHRQNLKTQAERRRLKTDPVSLYQHYKEEYWSRDPFLKRLEHPESRQAKQRMFDGLGYFVVTGGRQVPVAKKPSAKQRSIWGSSTRR